MCKQVLNIFRIERSYVNGSTLLTTKSNEFISYIYKFGVANTVFNLTYKTPKVSHRVLVTSGDTIVGFELSGKLFFLPFHTTKFDSNNLIDLSKTLSNAIIDYRFKNKVLLPAWLDEFQFYIESSTISEINELLKKSTELQSELSTWKNIKSILTISGDMLKKNNRDIRSIFQFKIDPIDEGREDAKILGDNSNTMFLIEIKGTNKGIKREHIN